MKNENKFSVDENQIINWFRDGEKPKNQWLIGTEHEKFIFKKKTYERINYSEKNGIKSILDFISANGSEWEDVYENNDIIGLKHQSGSSISLEPGGQFELSGAPLKNLHLTCKEAKNHLILMKSILNKFELLMLGLGHDPISKLNEISWMPKNRYNIMKKYMPTVGKHGLDMMSRTCTIQVNLDYSDEVDMVKKFQTSLALQPISTALFANSPFIEGEKGKYLSQRAFVWTETDRYRTGFPSIVFKDDFGYHKWVEYLLSIPMYFVYRKGKYIDVSGENFRSFLEGKLKGYEGIYPTLRDWETHNTTAFPEVRLKQFLEMRGADSGAWNRICALPAFWVGLLYDEISLERAFRLSKEFMNSEILTKSHISSARDGLEGKIGNFKIKEIAKELLTISYEGLKNRNINDENGISETQYLDPLFNIIETGKTSADNLLDQFDSKWKKNINEIFKNL